MEEIRRGSSKEEIDAENERRQLALEKNRKKLVERDKYEEGCVTSGTIAKMFGYHEKIIRNIILENKIVNRTVGKYNHQNGVPVYLYHPDDIRPYIKNQHEKTLLKIMCNDLLLHELLANNEAMRNRLKDTIREIECND